MHILIVDDHPLFIDGIRYFINLLDDDVEIMEATSVDEAVRKLDSGAPLDLLLLDLHMPGLDGLSIMQHKRIRNTCLPVIIISGEDDPHAINSVIAAGAMGFIPKSYSGKKLLGALRTVMGGEIFMPDEMRNQRQSPLRLDDEHDRDALGNSGITKRQYEVLKLLARGYSNKQISGMLFLTENTVKVHVSALLRALGAANRTECVSIARHHGLIQE
ncbi:MAG: response regulator transcription factor [Gammaproteobacteria bacterium]